MVEWFCRRSFPEKIDLKTPLPLRLIGLTVVMLVLLAGMTIVGYSGLRNVEEALRTVYVDRVIPMQQLRKITMDYFNVRIEVISAIGNSDQGAAKESVAEIDALVADASTEWQAYISTYLTPEEKQLVEIAKENFAAYDGIRAKVLSALTSGDRDTARHIYLQIAKIVQGFHEGRESETGLAAADLLGSAGELAKNGALLKEQVDAFLREVRS